MEIIAENFSDAYQQLRPLLLNAEEIGPRGLMTKELLHTTLVMKNPRCRLGYHPQRGFSLLFALTEAILLYGNVDDIRFFTLFNKNMMQFSDDGKTLHAAYGKRLHTFLPDIIKKLKEDHATRQALVNIYQKEDIRIKTKNTPCTVTLQFMIRNNKLNMHVYMRSNDFVWGTPYDTFMFSVLQEVLANELDIDVGTYYHTAASLHIYQQYWELIDALPSMKPIEFSVPYTLHAMQHLVSVLIGITYNVDPPYQVTPHNSFRELLIRESEYRNGIKIPQLSCEAQWALPFVNKWYK